MSIPCSIRIDYNTIMASEIGPTIRNILMLGATSSSSSSSSATSITATLSEEEGLESGGSSIESKSSSYLHPTTFLSPNEEEELVMGLYFMR